MFGAELLHQPLKAVLGSLVLSSLSEQLKMDSRIHQARIMCKRRTQRWTAHSLYPKGT